MNVSNPRKTPQLFAAMRIWFHGNYSGTEIGKYFRVSSNMSANVENKVASPYKSGIKTPHPHPVRVSFAIEEILISESEWRENPAAEQELPRSGFQFAHIESQDLPPSVCTSSLPQTDLRTLLRARS